MIVVLGIWETTSRAGWVSPLYFPPPTTTVRTLRRLITRDDLLGHAGLTLSRLGLGVALGGLPGLLLGWVMGWSRRARRVADPFVSAAHPIPKVALLPLIMVVFGIGELSKVIAIAVGVFFPLLINAMTGVRQISSIHFEVARNLGVRPLRMLVRVVIPGSLPFVMAGVRVALNLGLLITIAIELVSAGRGLGARLWLGWETFRPEEIWAILVVLSVIGLALSFGVHLLTRMLVPWQVEQET